MKRWKKLRRKIRRPFETGGYVLLNWIIPNMSRSAVVKLSSWLGRVAMKFPIREREIGLKNLDAVYGNTKTDAEKRAILATSLGTFSRTMLDVFWFSKNAEQRINEYVEFSDGPLAHLFFEDKAFICITAHMGSWEIIGQASAVRGVDLASIAATLKNKSVDQIIVKQRQKTGQTIIPREGALKVLISKLRTKGKAAFVLDQYTSPRKGGIVVDFLGLPMPVSSAPAALAYRTGTEILFGFCLPDTEGKYRIIIPEKISPPPYDKSTDMDSIVLELTRQIQDIISEQILKYPEFWLWSYKHWRQHPGPTCPSNYPNY